MPEQSLRDWLSDRSVWLQEASRRLFAGQTFTADELADLCLQEVLGKASIPGFVLPKGLFGAGSSKSLRLTSIQDIQGINALSPKKSLNFGNSNLSVVYGLNGSGKSGYVRILKHACGARHPGELHPNVFAAAKVEQKCKISYDKDGTAIQHDWLAASGVIDDLTTVDIFDTMCGHVYVAGENEVSYEPPILSFLSDLISISEDVASILDKKIQHLCSAKPKLPPEYATTSSEKWYLQISSKLSEEQTAKQCDWSAALEEELLDLQKRLSEKSPAEKATFLRKQKHNLEMLKNDVDEKTSALSDQCSEAIIDLKKDASKKKDAAKTAAEKVFANAPLDGIGSEVWKELWEKARQYSEQVAYKDSIFPVIGDAAKCVLCQQDLSADAKVRFQSFEEFVKGTLEADASKASKALRDAVSTLTDPPSEEVLRAKMTASGWDDEGVVKDLLAIYDALRKRRDALLTTDSVSELPPIPNSCKWVEMANQLTAAYEESALKFDEDSAGDNRAILQSGYLDLQAKKWLSQQRESIDEEIKRLKKLNILEEAKRLTATTGLSKKKGDLAEVLITKAYVKAFNDELKILGAGKIRVELVKTRVSKGHVLHQLRLCGSKGCDLEHVLSEGEFRIIALAAFLADVAGKAVATPFVFDDPISSLDQAYEETVVQRLIALSKDRQLIVFTHRLSLLGLIQDYAKVAGSEVHIVCLRQESWGAGEPGDTPLFAKKPERALNVLIGERLSGAKKVLDELGKELYEPIAKGLCSDFRILLERMIETDLLADVVQRYRRAVNTMGKIEKLALITAEDCKFFDDMMTKYSRYEHSQPGEAPVQLPLPDELQQDFNALKSWRDEFVKRDK